MTIKELLETLVADRGPITLLFIIGITLVQIAPIQINPWSAIFKWLGRKLNTEVIEKVDTIEERLDKHIEEWSECTLKERRARILDFSSSVLRGENYHKEKFEFMIAECDSYEDYCEDNDIKNGVAKASIAEIRRIYQDRLRNNDFLIDQVSKQGEE